MNFSPKHVSFMESMLWGLSFPSRIEYHVVACDSKKALKSGIVFLANLMSATEILMFPDRRLELISGWGLHPVHYCVYTPLSLEASSQGGGRWVCICSWFFVILLTSMYHECSPGHVELGVEAGDTLG